MTGFSVDPDSFAPVAAQLRQAAQSLQQAWAPVASDSRSVQFGAGNDVVSPLIQVSLQGAVSLVDRCMTTSQQALNGYATGLERMANTYTTTETATRASFTKG